MLLLDHMTRDSVDFILCYILNTCWLKLQTKCHLQSHVYDHIL